MMAAAAAEKPTIINVVSDSALIPTLLRDWGLSRLHPELIVNEIDNNQFLSLDLNAINILFPTETVGTKLKLQKHIAEIKEATVIVEESSGPVIERDSANESTKSIIENPGIGSPVISQACNTDSVKRKRGGSQSDFMDPDCEPAHSDDAGLSDSSNSSMSVPLSALLGKNQNSKTSQVKRKKVLKPTMRSQSVLKSKPEKETIPLDGSRRLVDPNKLIAKKTEDLSFLQQLFNLDLEDLLKNSLDGRAILNSYSTNSFLEEDERTSLVDIVVKWLLFRCTRPTKDDFICLRDKILSLFENEINVYYIPPKEQGENQTMARGKLFDRTRNLKEWMRKKGLLSRVKGQRKLVSVEKENIAMTDPNIEVTEEVEAALEWLKVMSEPWERVEEKWTVTSKYRMACLRNLAVPGETKIVDKVQTLSKSFKVLMEPKGHLLNDIDFTVKYGQAKANNLISNWPKFKKAIYKIVTENPLLVKDVDGKNLLKLLLKQTSDETECILILKLLPSLIPATRRVSLGSKKFKPSIKESRDVFLARVNTAAEVSNYISDVTASTKKLYGTKATVQPYILYVATEDEVPSASFYVIVDNFAYKLRNVVHAVDVCFKVFFAMDISYPVQCEHLWLFIQQLIYKVETEDDLKILNVEAFVKKVTLVMDSIVTES